MINFINYYNAPTPEIVPENEILQLTPAIYLGNPTGFGSEIGTYDIFNQDSLKQFKVSVGAINDGASPLLRLDTLDLYFDQKRGAVDHTVELPDFPLNKIQGGGQDGEPILGLPVRFQKVHFYASSASDGRPAEYYSIFLASDPVRISEFPMDCSETNKCESYSDEQKKTKAFPTRWNDSAYESRLVLGSTLKSELKAVQKWDELTCVDGRFCKEKKIADETSVFLTHGEGDDMVLFRVTLSQFIQMINSNFFSYFDNSILESIEGSEDGEGVTATIKSVFCSERDGISVGGEQSIDIACDCDSSEE